MRNKITIFWLTSETCTGEKSNYLKKKVLLGFQQNLGSGMTYKGLVLWEDFVFVLNENERGFTPVNYIMALLEIWDAQFLLGVGY